MNIQYPPDPPAPDVCTFEQLTQGAWYRGVQSGRLYFFYLGASGEPRLLRADDNCECAERYQRGGTFRPVEVTVIVHARDGGRT